MSFIIRQRITRIAGWVLAMCVLAFTPQHAVAVEVTEGFFSGAEMQPMFGAKPDMLGTEPATVLVFRATPENFDLLARFDAWYKQPHQYKYPIFGVVAVGENDSSDVIEESLRQRDLGFPIFASKGVSLDSDPYHLLLLEGGEARRVNTTDFADIEKQMAKRAVRAGLVAVGGSATTAGGTTASAAASATPAVPNAATSGSATAAADASTSTPAVPGRTGVFVNSRFNFRVRFPKGYEYVVSQNSDGAVARPPAGSQLDIRAWAANNSTDAEGNAGRVDLPDFIKQHLDFVREGAAGGQVTVERRLAVEDGDNEGRDVIYSYVKPQGDVRQGNKGVRIRGRLQVFEADGVFKCVGIEGPAAEFDRNSEMVEGYIDSFRPDANASE